ncbi:MAG TPA: Crp/Fnr family transcriptional regulator [Burkholderiaceae bacterium]|nr:Crp/Fnr family transcriptional regulator [Burkholderiaceae bacterium]
MHDLLHSTLQRDEALACYPSLACVDPSLTSLPPGCGPHVAPAGKQLFDAGQECKGFPLILSGEVKVFRESEDGRRLELYRVAPGELCLASSTSLFQRSPLSASGVTTQVTRLLMVPERTFHAWLSNPEFRDEVLGLFAQRMMDLIALVDAVAFRKLEQRLAGVLLGHGPVLHITHQALADQLGTVREIVSRLLSRFEQSGWVTLFRERIHITDIAALRACAGEQA